VQVKR